MEFQQYLSDLGLPPALVVILIAILPVVELRGAIPVAINVFEFPWVTALVLAFIGNLLPVPFILLALRWISSKFERFKSTRRFLNYIYARTRKRSALVEKYKYLGLTLFVSIPLPMTGAWTGSIAAVLLGLSFFRSLASISLGILIAGAVVVSLSLLGWMGGIIAAIALTSFLLIRYKWPKP